MKFYISQPLPESTKDFQLMHRRVRKAIEYKFPNEDIEIIDDVYVIGAYINNEIKCLGRFLMEGLGEADRVLFVPGWEYSYKCVCEHYIASVYRKNLNIFYLGYDNVIRHEPEPHFNDPNPVLLPRTLSDIN